MTRGLSPIYQNGTYLRHNPTWHREDSAAKADEILDFMKAHAVEPRSICDIGCGAGGILDHLSRMVAWDVRLCGYEPSDQAFALCPSNRKTNLSFFHRALPEEGEYFDLVLVIDVVEHVDDYIGFLKALRPTGRQTIFRIPLNVSVQSVLFKSGPMLGARRDFGHIHYFTRETALATLYDTGYRVIDLRYSYGPVSPVFLGWRQYLPKAAKKTLSLLSPPWVARLLDGFSLLILTEPQNR